MPKIPLLKGTLNVRAQSWKRTTGGRHKDPGLANYQATIFFLLQKAIVEYRAGVKGYPYKLWKTSDLGISLTFEMVGHMRLDIDNAEKAIFDAGQPNIWQDDRQFIESNTKVKYGSESNRILVEIYAIKEQRQRPPEHVVDTCGDCGAKVDADWLLCSRCGWKV